MFNNQQTYWTITYLYAPFSGRATSWPSTRSSTLTSVISLRAWSVVGGRASRRNLHSCSSFVISESRHTRGSRSRVWRTRSSSYLDKNFSPHDENSASFLFAVWALTFKWKFRGQICKYFFSMPPPSPSLQLRPSLLLHVAGGSYDSVTRYTNILHNFHPRV